MIGTTIAHYRITEKLGEGGMGVVYRAQDTKLGRDVAIKVLPEAFARDSERMERFQREARTLASLNHPGIAAIYGLEEADVSRAIVMELAEGETLAERIGRGALAVDEALELARQIAEALEAAHEKGVIHRDLKPGNIMVSAEGQVKVLDFGLAKALAGDVATADPENSPTVTMGATQAGVILGTAGYMSPEQAKGQAVDRRADIWAFGVVLYEMLTGRRAFGGDTVADSLAKIIEREPDWSLLPPRTSVPIRRLIRRCLEKDAKKRLQAIGDARIEIEEARSGPEDPEVDSRPAWRRLAPWMASTALVTSAFVIALVWPTETIKTVRPTARYTISLPENAPLAPPSSRPAGIGSRAFALSKNGSRLVYVALIENQRQLYVRDMATGEFQSLPGTDSAFCPFFSPDGETVAFFAHEKLKTVALDGSEPVVLADADTPVDGGWFGSYLYFTPREFTGIWRVPETGGDAELVVSHEESGGDWLSFPAEAPGSKVICGRSTFGGLVIADLQTGKQKPIRRFGSAPRYVRGGSLLFTEFGRLMVARFDPNDGSIEGNPAVVLDDLQTSEVGASQYSYSENGDLAYVPGSHSSNTYVTWIDRNGARERTNVPRLNSSAFDLSPDGEKLAIEVAENEKRDLWIYDLRRGSRSRLTTTGKAGAPIWDSGGESIVYRVPGTPPDPNRILRQRLGGPPSSTEISRGRQLYPQVISPANGQLVFNQYSPETGFDLWVAVLEDSGAPAAGAKPLLDSQHTELFASISPDGEWIAYTSNESGRGEVYLRRYPELDQKVTVSTEGGEEPRWNPNGGEIVYRDGNRWYSVDVTTHPELRVDKPRLLFEGPFINVRGYSWDFHPDGNRFLVLENPEHDQPATKLTMIVNLDEMLRVKLEAEDRRK